VEPGIVYAAATDLGGVGLAEVVFHAVDAAYQAGLLQQAVVFRNRQGRLGSPWVKTVRFQPFKVLSWLPARYYYTMRRDTLDRTAARYIRSRGAALVHGWTNESRQTLSAAQQAGAVAVLERNFCHPRQSLKIMAAEYAGRGVPWPPPPQPWLRFWDHWTREQTRALEEFALADYILVPSQFAYETFINQGHAPEKLVLIPRGVDVQRFQPGSPPEDVFRVLFVGLLGFRKGVPYLLEAWERLGLKDAELVLVGSVHDEIRPTLRAYEHLPNLKIVGFHPDPAALFAQSTVFCFPSLDEGSAKVTYEALAAGLPLITTPEAGSVARDGREGIIIPPRQVEPLMAALERLYRNPQEIQAMSQAARARAQHFTWEHYAGRLVAFYRHALTAPGARFVLPPDLDFDH
jgi:glycosyltransferase involved in cell wall biosynthesis